MSNMYIGEELEQQAYLSAARGVIHKCHRRGRTGGK